MNLRSSLHRFALTASLVAAPPLSAASTVRYLPGAAETSGQTGSRWESTLRVLNVGSAAATVDIGLIPLQGSAAPPAVTRTISPGTLLTVERPLSTLFGSASPAGTITVTVDEAALLQAYLTTQNVAQAPKVYGLALPEVRSSAAIGAGQTGHAPWVSHDADMTGGYRTNIAVTFLEPGAAEIRLFDGSNAPAGTLPVSATAAGWTQVSATDVMGGRDLAVGRAEIAVSAGKVIAYVTVVDNVTSDGVAIQAQTVPPGQTDLVLAGAARTAGLNGTYWSTDLRLFNAESAAADVLLTAHVPGRSAKTKTVPLGAGATVEIADLLGPSGLDVGEGIAGAVRVHSSRAVVALARVNNSDPAGLVPGTFSTFVLPIPTGRFLAAGQTGTIPGIEHVTGSTGFRTNLAVVGGIAGGAGTLVLRDASGTKLAEAGFSQEAFAWAQQGMGTWFPGVTVPSGARVDVVVRSGSVHAYAARSDNASGDGVVVPAAAVEAARIVDAHTHLYGKLSVTESDWLGAAAVAVTSMDRWGISKLLVPAPPQTPEQSPGAKYECDEMSGVLTAFPGRFAFLCGGGTLNVMIQKAVKQGGVSASSFRAEAERVAAMPGFAGFGEMATLHVCKGAGHPYEVAPPDHELFKALVDVAATKGVPIDIHQEAVAAAAPLPDPNAGGCTVNPAVLTPNITPLENLLDYANGKGVKIVWQHVGWDNTHQWTPTLTDQLLGRHANLYLALKYSPSDSGGPNALVDSGGKLTAAWSALLLKYPDRFMTGSDFFFPSPKATKAFPASADQTWGLLSQLPEEVRRKVGWENVTALYRLGQ